MPIIPPFPLTAPDDLTDEQLAEVAALMDETDRLRFVRWLLADSPDDFGSWVLALPDDDERTAA